MKRTLFTQLPLEPVHAPRSRCIVGRDEPCDHGLGPGDGISPRYSGSIPCTGALICDMCGTQWDADTGLVIR